MTRTLTAEEKFRKAKDLFELVENMKGLISVLIGDRGRGLTEEDWLDILEVMLEMAKEKYHAKS